MVTGAGKGIGRQISLDLAKNGAFVVAISRSTEDLKSLQEQIQQMGKTCKMIQADLGNVEECKRAATEAAQLDIDLLVNNAGISKMGLLVDLTVEDWDAVLNVNLRAVFIISQIISKGMIKRRKGAIVNISSQASSVGLEKHSSYCASKGALDQLTRVMSLELGKHNIRVNAVNPTVVLTDMGKTAWSDPKRSGPMLAQIPLGRFAEPSDVSEAVLFLLSPKASMINGITLPIDGGFLASKL
uniref:L-xylulose reductase n=1 Tax=Arcella intermedia TaxID=1963864 RepID=A0A6B2LG63_9EUKA